MKGYNTCGYNPLVRRARLLRRLAKADGVSYDDLCRSVIEQFPHARGLRFASPRGVRAVRDLLFDELAATEADESVWLTPAGWAALAELSEAKAEVA